MYDPVIRYLQWLIYIVSFTGLRKAWEISMAHLGLSVRGSPETSGRWDSELMRETSPPPSVGGTIQEGGGPGGIKEEALSSALPPLW